MPLLQILADFHSNAIVPPFTEARVCTADESAHIAIASVDGALCRLLVLLLNRITSVSPSRPK